MMPAQKPVAEGHRVNVWAWVTLSACTLLGCAGADDAAEEGTITVTGASTTLPQQTYTARGPHEGQRDGQQIVHCSYYPYGREEGEGPTLLLGAGHWHEYRPLALVELSGLTGVAPFTRQDSYGDPGAVDLLLSVTLPVGNLNYEYWYFRDPFALTGEVFSTCTTTVTEFTETHLAGATDCSNLVAAPGSPDEAPEFSPSPTATVSMTFDCPLRIEEQVSL